MIMAMREGKKKRKPTIFSHSFSHFSVISFALVHEKTRQPGAGCLVYTGFRSYLWLGEACIFSRQNEGVLSRSYITIRRKLGYNLAKLILPGRNSPGTV